MRQKKESRKIFEWKEKWIKYEKFKSNDDDMNNALWQKIKKKNKESSSGGSGLKNKNTKN